MALRQKLRVERKWHGSPSREHLAEVKAALQRVGSSEKENGPGSGGQDFAPEPPAVPDVTHGTVHSA
jgi:hypothetical protein